MSVARISLVSPERSKQIESILLRMAQTGQLRGKVTESQLIDLLEQVHWSWFFLVSWCTKAHSRQAEEAHNKSNAKGSIVVGTVSGHLPSTLADTCSPVPAQKGSG
jgi:hypothetical protein